MIRMLELLMDFDISKATLYKWIDKGCPAHYVGKLLFFDKDEVISWIKNHKESE